ncbi:dephospho-CoA kinase [Streptococcus caprae]|uniref:Dephospho-CoA kinase n=1 Tax=Streptococcus caprae TaxID=1640501 RepID=A0ABV8CUZ7_9STRE
MATVIGLTGSIASGKSTVSAYLHQQGYCVIDADQVVHELQAKGGRLYEALVQHFGPEIVREDGELDRPKLSELIFSNPDIKQQSAHLQDQVIREELAERLKQAQTEQDVVFMDIPLLYELGYESWCDEVWLVYVDRETQLSRLMLRNGYSQEEAQKRLDAQLSLEEKKARADVVLENNRTLDCLYEQVDLALKTMGEK